MRLDAIERTFVISAIILKDKIKHIAAWTYRHLELISWIIILILLMLPMSQEQHFSLCPLQNIGFEHCPGCGLGHSCNQALHGNIIQSLRMHPFGIFAIIVIISRIIDLLRTNINQLKTKSL